MTLDDMRDAAVAWGAWHLVHWSAWEKLPYQVARIIRDYRRTLRGERIKLFDSELRRQTGRARNSEFNCIGNQGLPKPTSSTAAHEKFPARRVALDAAGRETVARWRKEAEARHG